jgi:hypothetical protein
MGFGYTSNMTQVLDANVVISTKVEEIKKVIYTIQVRQRVYTLVKTWIDEKLESEIVLNEAGWNITTPSTLIYLREVIEQSI